MYTYIYIYTHMYTYVSLVPVREDARRYIPEGGRLVAPIFRIMQIIAPISRNNITHNNDNNNHTNDNIMMQIIIRISCAYISHKTIHKQIIHRTTQTHNSTNKYM